MEHSSPEALKQYMKDHPDADAANHTVSKKPTRDQINQALRGDRPDRKKSEAALNQLSSVLDMKDSKGRDMDLKKTLEGDLKQAIQDPKKFLAEVAEVERDNKKALADDVLPTNVKKKIQDMGTKVQKTFLESGMAAPLAKAMATNAMGSALANYKVLQRH